MRMLRLGFALLGALSLAGCAQTARDPDFVKLPRNGSVMTHEQFTKLICGGNPCRENGISVRLKMEDGPDFTQSLPAGPAYIKDGTISIFAGETLYIETDHDDAGPKNPRVVFDVVHPESTFILHFAQLPTEESKVGMVLAVANPYDRPVLYNALIVRPKSPDFEPTSIIPVRPHLLGIESWPYPIAEVLIGQMKFVDSGSDTATR